MPEPSSAEHTDFAGIPREMVGLLEAAGHRSAHTLAVAEASLLHRELVRANEVLRLVDSPPDLQTLRGWVASAREAISGGGARSRNPLEPVDHEADPAVR